MRFSYTISARLCLLRVRKLQAATWEGTKTDSRALSVRFHVDAHGRVGKYDVDNGPGYRVLELQDGGTISSCVVRPTMQEGFSQLSDLLAGPRLERRPMPSL